MTYVCVVVGFLDTCRTPVYLLNKSPPVLKKCICLKKSIPVSLPVQNKSTLCPGTQARAQGRARTWAPDTWEESASKATP